MFNQYLQQDTTITSFDLQQVSNSIATMLGSQMWEKLETSCRFRISSFGHCDGVHYLKIQEAKLLETWFNTHLTDVFQGKSIERSEETYYSGHDEYFDFSCSFHELVNRFSAVGEGLKLPPPEQKNKVPQSKPKYY